MSEKMYKYISKKALVPWVFCRRKPSVNAGSGIISDTVRIDNRKNI